MKNVIYTCLLVLIAFAITGCEDPELSAPTGHVPENAIAGHQVSQITITNTGNSTLASLVLNGNGAENFSVDTLGAITVATGANLDYENVNIYNLTAVATSTKGDVVTGDININILDVADVVPSIDGLKTTVAENTPYGTLIATVGVLDSGDSAITSFSVNDTTTFSINEKGEIRTNSPLDYESINIYQFSVTATNTAGISNTATVEVFISNIADVIPRILGFEATIDKTIAVGSVIGQVSIEDAGDSPITSFSISEPQSFDIGLDGVITTKVALDAPMYELSVVATNLAGINTALVSLAVKSDAFVIKPFTAKYYFEDDGTQAGQGTDGNDTSIIPVLKHTETVKKPSINYSWAYEFDIDSYNFYATWEGEIEVNEVTNIDASFDVSWSNVEFYVDGVLISKWANSNKVIPLALEVGIHSVRVEYHNHWHTTGFNVSFTNHEKTDVSQDISAKISPTSQINYITAYETNSATSIYNEVEITLPLSDRPQVLFLSSYAAINWVIKNPYNTPIEGVIVSSFAPTSSIEGVEDAFILEATNLNWRTENMDKGVADILSMTGKNVDYMYDAYGIGNIEIPSVY